MLTLGMARPRRHARCARQNDEQLPAARTFRDSGKDRRQAASLVLLGIRTKPRPR
jgi:hypothetical protein